MPGRRTKPDDGGRGWQYRRGLLWVRWFGWNCAAIWTPPLAGWRAYARWAFTTDARRWAFGVWFEPRNDDDEPDFTLHLGPIAIDASLARWEAPDA